MAKQAFVLTLLIMLAGAVGLLGTCAFLAPYRGLIVGKYGWVILSYTAALFTNLFALIYTLSRWLFLKDTGRKLAHLEKGLAAGSPISQELAERLRHEGRI